MPILYVHGVATRSRAGFRAIEPYLRRLIAPAIADDAEGVLIDDAFWGEVGARFAWEGASRPRTRLLGMGGQATSLSPVEAALTAAAFADALNRVPRTPAAAPLAGELVSGGATAVGVGARVRLKDLDFDALSDLLAALVDKTVGDPDLKVRTTLAADAVARDPATQAALAQAADAETELDELLERVRRRMQAEPGLVGMGTPPWFSKLRDHLGEAVGRATDLPAYAVSVVAAELRPKLNESVSLFLGDVFAYLSDRGDAAAPGEIPRRLLAKLSAAQRNKAERGGEPLVVLSHSMGGQLVYDAVTHFLPKSPDPDLRGVRVDFWCATASQVPFFEEVKLFRASNAGLGTPDLVDFPQHQLGVWWNVWDHNDFLSFTAKDIMAGAIDEALDSGMSLIEAHGGYLKRPSFYRAFAKRLEAAKARGWRTS